MFESTHHLALLMGRIFLALIFVLSGVMKIFAWSPTMDHMTAEGMPAASILLPLAILVEIGGGLSVLLGFQCRFGALLLAAFLVPATLVFHDFWTDEGMQMQAQMQHFLKNVAIIGGLLSVAAAGAGRYSIDAWSQRMSWGLPDPGSQAVAR